MFNQFTHLQNVADQIKCMVLDGPPIELANRRRALDTISRFERCAWQPQVFEQAAAEVFAADGTTIVYRGDPADIIHHTQRVLTAYMVLMNCGQPEVYGTREAADYLGISVRMVKHYVYNTGELSANKAGNSLAFTQAMLDEFKARMPQRKRGYQHKKVAE